MSFLDRQGILEWILNPSGLAKDPMEARGLDEAGDRELNDRSNAIQDNMDDDVDDDIDGGFNSRCTVQLWRCSRLPGVLLFDFQLRWHEWGRCSLAVRFWDPLAAAFLISSLSSPGMGWHVYSVPYHFSLFPQVPGKSRETMVIRKLSGRKQSRPCLVRLGSNLRKRLYPLSRYSRRSGFYMVKLSFLVKRYD
ncbi:hypothetical protein VTI28DRAFT_8256 [Corynascus sepedonium]